MDYAKNSLAELRAIAKEKGIKGITGLKKQELINTLIEYVDEMPAVKAQTAKTPAAKDPEVKTLITNKSEVKISASKKSVKGPQTAKDTAEKKSPVVKMNNEKEHSTVKDLSKASRNNYSDKGMKKNVGNTTSVNVKENIYSGKADVLKRENSHGNGGYNSNNYSGNFNNIQNRRSNNAEFDSGRDEKKTTANQSPTEMEQLDSGEVKSGILEVLSDGYGFIRCDNYLPGERDVYVSPALIRRFSLRTGDVIVGNTRVKNQNEKFSALLFLKSVNGYNPNEIMSRTKFEDLVPIFPNERIHLETAGSGTAMRMVDLISPIGKGQRGMIVSQPKTGKTTLLKQVAKAVKQNHPEMHLIILLIDERPEEVTDIKESIEGDQAEVIYSTFDELPDNHKRVSEMVIERAKRLVEHGGDVMILLDSITRLARAYNLTVQPSGRTLSGGLDPAALHMPKKFFGAARNMRNGGSLTILATALVDTGSRMDDVVFEEFKGTGNMELVLDRSLSEKRIFPAIDLPRSSTRRDDLLLTQSEMEASFLMRRAMNGMKSDEAVEQIINMFVRTKNNNEFIEMIKKVKIV